MGNEVIADGFGDEVSFVTGFHKDGSKFGREAVFDSVRVINKDVLVA